MPAKPDLTWITNIPFSTHNPSNDQPNMLINNNNNEIIWNVDHVGFNSAINNSGTHAQSTYITPAGTTPPITVQPGSVVVYPQTNVQSQLFANSDAGQTAAVTNQYQLTRFVDASFSLFGTNVNDYNSVGTDFTGGWTFLPGNLLYQYGSFVPAAAGFFGSNTNGIITFPLVYTTVGGPFNIQLTWISKNGSISDNPLISVKLGNVTASAFIWASNETTTDVKGIYWTAIGV